jgi:hypothetical protein
MASSEPGYERLGAKILSLPDVIAQSVGFIGPVFSSAFVIPLVIGVISASGKGGGVALPISVLMVTLLLDLFWPGLFALPATPHYFALFAWGSTFGGLALVVVYLLMSVGSLRTFAGSRRRVSLVVSAAIGIVITVGAIFASFYKVTSPTILAPWFALGLLVVGYASTFVLRARRPASTELTDLSEKTAA